MLLSGIERYTASVCGAGSTVEKVTIYLPKCLDQGQDRARHLSSKENGDDRSIARSTGDIGSLRVQVDQLVDLRIRINPLPQSILSHTIKSAIPSPQESVPHPSQLTLTSPSISRLTTSIGLFPSTPITSSPTFFNSSTKPGILS